MMLSCWSFHNSTSCIKWTIEGALSASTCRDCDPGSYAAAPGSAVCSPCDPGFFAPSAKSANCSQCSDCKSGTYAKHGVGCEQCASGSYSPNDRATACIPCDAGHYSEEGALACIECPSGFYASNSNSSNCLPCPPKTFSNSTKATSCSHCENCLIGSKFELQSNITGAQVVYNDPYFEKQNAKAISKTTDPADVLRIIFICLCVVLGIVIAIVALIALVFMHNRGKTYSECVKIILATIDVFSLKHYTKVGFPVLNKTTPYGGVVTLLFIIMAITIFAFSILDAVNDLNVIEIGTVLPKESIGINTVKGKYALRLALQNFGDSNCTLNSKDIIATNFEGAYAYSSVLLSNSTCIIEFLCASCYLSGTTQRIEFMFGQRFAAASAIDYTLTLPYFDATVKELNITERVVPANAQENMFKGPKPTEISLSLTTTKYLQISTVDYFFYNLISKITKTTFSTSSIGYSATRNPTSLGSTVHYTNFWSDQTSNGYRALFQNGLIFNFLGSEEALCKYLELDLHIGISGLLCAPDVGASLQGMLGKIPQNRLLITSNCPLNTPQNLEDAFEREAKNEPSNIYAIVKVIAKIWNMSEKETAAQIRKNSMEFYNIPEDLIVVQIPNWQIPTKHFVLRMKQSKL